MPLLRQLSWLAPCAILAGCSTQRSARVETSAVSPARPTPAIVASPEVQILVDAATADIKAGKYDDAGEKLDRAIKAQPDVADAYYQRGRVLHQKKDFDRAKADLDQAVRLKPDFTAAYEERGIVAMARRRWEAAIVDFDRVLTVDPNNVAILVRRGTAHRQAGALDAAIADLTKAIELQPNDAATYTERGFTWRAKHQIEHVVADFERARELHPTASAWTNLGAAKLARGDHNGAVAAFNEALRLNPSFAVAYDARGMARQDVGDLAGAMADFTEALRNDSNLENSYQFRGFVALRLGKWQLAVDDLSEFIRRRPVYPLLNLTYCSRGEANERLGKLDAATIDYTSALRLKPDYERARIALDKLKSSRGDTAAALADLDQAISKSPSSYLLWAARADIKESTGDSSGADADYEQAIAINPSDAASYIAVASAKLQRKDYDGAIAIASRGLKEIGDHYRLFALRGTAYCRLKDYPRAIADLDRAIDPASHVDEKSTDDSTIVRFDRAFLIGAYESRVTAKHAMGDERGALSDLDAIVQNGGRTYFIFQHRAELEQVLGYLDHAMADVAVAIQIDPQQSGAYFVRAKIRYALADLDGSAKDLVRATELRKQTDEYVHFFRFLADRRLGRDPGVEKFAVELATWKDGWPKRIAAYFVGQISEADLLKEAAAPGEPPIIERQCEAYYYIGMTRLLNGNKEGGIDFLSKCVATQVKRFIEYDFAEIELAALREPAEPAPDKHEPPKDEGGWRIPVV
jgi:tetratricopeptide (TPR) repeat protein